MVDQKVNYSVYLVTDSTPAILGDKDLCHVVEASLKGGVTCVQYRDKTSDDDLLIRTAKKLHEITRRYNVPLLINDRVDVAVEVGCEGVHIGQDDMEFEKARAMLGPGKIIGVTASSRAEAIKASRAGADYLGIGTVYATDTKKDTKSIIGTEGVSDILAYLEAHGHAEVPTVCIGGVNTSNVRKVMKKSAAPRKSLDGVAIVSAIVAAEQPEAAARELVDQVFWAKIPQVIRAIVNKTPLSHNMTNLVVQNFAANVALCVGASPIMSNYAEEAADLAKLGGALVVNMGTVTPDGIKNYLQAIKAYNEAGRPIVLDPVGAGATAVRRSAVKTLLSSGRFTVIKGNESEIQTLHGATVTQRGVDSDSNLSVSQRASLVRSLASSTSSVVLMTGKTDILSDGRRVFRIDNGHEILGAITGTGCTLGTTISAAVAAYPGDRLVAAVAATAMFGWVAELAMECGEVVGPGTFVPVFLDKLYSIKETAKLGDVSWSDMLKIQAVEVEEGS